MKKTIDAKSKKKIKKHFKEKILEKLTPKQEMFCRIYTQNTYLFGNGTLAYDQAYGPKLESLPQDDAIYAPPDPETGLREKIKESSYDSWYQVCSNNASRLLRNARINERVKKLLVESMIDAEVDSELIYTIKQRDDFSAKMRAISEYNKLKSRITQKTDLTSNGNEIKQIVGMRIVDESDNEPKPISI